MSRQSDTGAEGDFRFLGGWRGGPSPRPAIGSRSPGRSSTKPIKPIPPRAARALSLTGFQPYLRTPLFPSYPSGHATLSGTVSEVLASRNLERWWKRPRCHVCMGGFISKATTITAWSSAGKSVGAWSITPGRPCPDPSPWPCTSPGRRGGSDRFYFWRVLEIRRFRSWLRGEATGLLF